MIKVNLDGEFFTHIKEPNLLAEIAASSGVDLAQLSIDADDLAAFEYTKRITKIRTEIEQTVGDTPAIQGTIADNVALLMEGIGRFMDAAAESNDPVIAAAAMPLRDDLKPFIGAIDDGSCVPTHRIKEGVVVDACVRTHGVSSVLIANADG